MDNLPDNPQETQIEKIQFDFPTFIARTLKAGFALLVFGIVFICLVKFNIATDVIAQPLDTRSFLGGAIVLVALTFLGIPLIPAATAGVAVWWFVQSLIEKLY